MMNGQGDIDVSFYFLWSKALRQLLVTAQEGHRQLFVDLSQSSNPTHAVSYFLGGIAHAAYGAPALPDRAEPLPHSVYGRARALKDARLFRFMEAEDLTPMAADHGCVARAVEDVEHNYHPSGGKYLHVIADRPGDYVDCRLRFPPSLYK